MFRQGKIIRKFRARNGREIVLRYPKTGDVGGILKMVNKMWRNIKNGKQNDNGRENIINQEAQKK